MRTMARVLFIVVFGLSAAGCSKCGDWYFGPTQHSCHDDNKVN